MRHFIAAAFVSTLFLSQLAQAKMPERDIVGAQDHSLLSRFQGAKIVGYKVREFDEVDLATNKRDGRGVVNQLHLEGKFTRIAYYYPPERSGLEVMRNYQAALDKAGLKTVFACSKEECGVGFGEHMNDKRLGNNFIQASGSNPFNYGRFTARYVLAKGTMSNGTPVHVAIYVVDPTQDTNGGISVEVVETKAMETGKVAASLNAGEMAAALTADGKVALYGVYFDTDKADVKPESAAMLAEMAKLLQHDPALKVHVVGHTDNQGSTARNLELSQKRADAVVKALTGQYKIDAKRLSAKGIASYAPVASNDSDAGREKNRRVELVKQ